MTIALTDAEQTNLHAQPLDEAKQPDPNAVMTFGEDSAGTIITLGAVVPGVAPDWVWSVPVLAVTGAKGTAHVTPTATDLDGKAFVGVPQEIDVAPAGTDTTTIVVTSDPPTPKAA